MLVKIMLQNVGYILFTGVEFTVICKGGRVHCKGVVICKGAEFTVRGQNSL